MQFGDCITCLFSLYNRRTLRGCWGRWTVHNWLYNGIILPAQSFIQAFSSRRRRRRRRRCGSQLRGVPSHHSNIDDREPADRVTWPCRVMTSSLRVATGDRRTSTLDYSNAWHCGGRAPVAEYTTEWGIIALVSTGAICNIHSDYFIICFSCYHLICMLK